MYTDLQPIDNTYGNNFGGLCYFEFVPKQWITSLVVDPVSRQIATAIGLGAGKDWLRADCLYDSLEYLERQKQTEAGTYFACELTGSLLRDEAERANILDTLRYHELVVRYYDRNGGVKVIGDASQGMRLSSELSTGSEAAGRAISNFSLVIDLKHKAPFFSL